MKQSTARNLSNFRNMVLGRKTSVTLTVDRPFFLFLEDLYEQGLIRGFQRLSGQKVIVFLKYYKGKSVVQQFRQLSTPRYPLSISYQILAKEKEKNSNLYLFTAKGIQERSKALQLRLGGEVFCKVR